MSANMAARARRTSPSAPGRQTAGGESSVVLDPTDIGAGTGVDLYLLAGLDEQRDAHHGPRFQRGRLSTATGSVAFQPGIGLRDLQGDEVWGLDHDRGAVPE